MLISIMFAFDCCPCGVQTEGLMVHNVRVNKASVRSVANDKGLGFIPGECKECNAPLGPTARRYIHADDLVKVNAARERKGWPPLDSGDMGTVEIRRAVAEVRS